jgi:hypothetical protein
MLLRYLPVIFLLTALVLALAPLEAAGQTPVPNTADIDAAHAGATPKADKPRPRTAGAPVNANAAKTPVPPGEDVRKVRPAEAFPPERIAPSNPQTPQAKKEDPRSVEERADPGG